LGERRQKTFLACKRKKGREDLKPSERGLKSAGIGDGHRLFRTCRRKE